MSYGANFLIAWEFFKLWFQETFGGNMEFLCPQPVVSPSGVEYVK